MGQICIRFDQSTEDTLRKNAGEKGISVANYIRSLVDLGMKVEEASQGGNGDIDFEKLLKELQIKSCKSTIENLLVTRQIYTLINNGTDKNPEEMLKGLSEKAQAYVDGLIGNDA